jgi:hypothetical protein
MKASQKIPQENFDSKEAKKKKENFFFPATLFPFVSI